jgi:hypothetical protein
VLVMIGEALRMRAHQGRDVGLVDAVNTSSA